METTGSFEDENEETLADKTIAEGEAHDFELGLPTFDGRSIDRGNPGEDQPEQCETDEEVSDDDKKEKAPPKNEVLRESALEVGLQDLFEYRNVQCTR